MSTKKWHTFVHSWEFDTPLEQLILVGPMALKKYGTEIFVPTYDGSFTTITSIQNIPT